MATTRHSSGVNTAWEDELSLEYLGCIFVDLDTTSVVLHVQAS